MHNRSYWKDLFFPETDCATIMLVAVEREKQWSQRKKPSIELECGRRLTLEREF
jgi:hypothetical protein